MSQRGVHFDQLFGWELTLLEPGPFWAEVPDLLKPIYHFFNVPIQSGSSDPQSPLRLIRWVGDPIQEPLMHYTTS